MKTHVCDSIESFPVDKFHQLGKGRGRKLLIIGESPAPNGWILSGMACYRSDGKILPTGKRLNELLKPFNLSVETSGFTELVKCFVAKRTELKSCARKCLPILLEQLKRGDYKLLIILGVQTTKIFSDILGQELVMGTIQDIELGGTSYSVLPIYHPSPINPVGQTKNRAIMKRNAKEIVLLLR
jgi:hypothetical protein